MRAPTSTWIASIAWTLLAVGIAAHAQSARPPEAGTGAVVGRVELLGGRSTRLRANGRLFPLTVGLPLLASDELIVPPAEFVVVKLDNGYLVKVDEDLTLRVSELANFGAPRTGETLTAQLDRLLTPEEKGRAERIAGAQARQSAARTVAAEEAGSESRARSASKAEASPPPAPSPQASGAAFGAPPSLEPALQPPSRTASKRAAAASPPPPPKAQKPSAQPPPAPPPAIAMAAPAPKPASQPALQPARKDEDSGRALADASAGASPAEGKSGPSGSGLSGAGRSGGGFGATAGTEELESPRPSAAPHAEVAVSLVQSDGIAELAVRKGLAQALGRLRACYEVGIARDPSIAGQLTIALTLTPGGEVSKVAIGRSTLHAKALEQCVKSALARAQFAPHPGSSPATARAVLRFRRRASR